MTNPFDSDGADPARKAFLVLVNTIGQHSLWPAHLETPAGWPVALGPARRTECMDFISRRPSPLRLTTAPPAAA
ncbi:MbtH family protein [Streptomyces goshikiensis]|uniref:MbtH family protein n=1 Tax=Streptomyces goshikiensis TaxID=1942 RepID=UPI00367FC95C